MLRYHKKIVLKPCKGLGDAIYAYPIAKYLIEKNPDIKLEILSKYWEIYNQLNVSVRLPSQNDKFDIDCRYLNRKEITETNQFQDVCINAGVEEIPFEIDWVPNKIYEYPKRICLIRSPYLGMELRRTPVVRPDMSSLREIIDELKKDYHTVLLSHKDDGSIYDLPCDTIIDKTSVFELIDLVYQSDLIIGQLGHILTCAEAMNKKMLVIYPTATLNSEMKFFNTITPKKVITKNTTKYVFDSDLNQGNAKQLLMQKINDLINN